MYTENDVKKILKSWLSIPHQENQLEIENWNHSIEKYCIYFCIFNITLFYLFLFLYKRLFEDLNFEKILKKVLNCERDIRFYQIWVCF